MRLPNLSIAVLAAVAGIATAPPSAAFAQAGFGPGGGGGAAEGATVQTETKATTRLYVKTLPPGAQVTLDGKPLGASDGLFLVPAGTAKVSVQFDGAEPQVRQVEIVEGRITRVEVSLAGDQPAGAAAANPGVAAAAREQPAVLREGLGGRANAKKMAMVGGGAADTAAAVDRALEWLIAHQMPDGGWSFDLTQCPNCAGKCSHGGDKNKAEDRCGATAMALLPFLGRGYTHMEGPYKQQLARGVNYLAELSVKGKGKVHGQGGSSVSQGLAGIALSESYAMTQDQRLAMPARLALTFIIQEPEGGAWRYKPKEPGDTSAVGWRLMALRSGHMAYLDVGDNVLIKRAVEFLDSVQDYDGVSHGYTDPGKDSGMAAVGLLCRMYLGWDKNGHGWDKKDDPSLKRGVERLAERGPTTDLYYDYCATQFMLHMGADVWAAWNDKMKGMLLKTQSAKDHEAGSWYEGVNGGHGAETAGRLYCTALASMILEVYYRHLPLYGAIRQSVDAEFKD